MSPIPQDSAQERSALEFLRAVCSLDSDLSACVREIPALLGKALGADCALYNRLESGLLVCLGQWQGPADLPREASPEGHVCFDVIRDGKEEPLFVRRLQDSPYARSDANVARYGLTTYIGQAVFCGRKAVGAVCLLFKSERAFSEGERFLLQLAGAALSFAERGRAVSDALRREREYAEQLVETANAMVIGLDLSGKILMFNSTAERISGYRREELTGKSWFETLVPRERYPEVWDSFRQLPADKLPEFLENPILTRDGRERVISWRNSVLRENGRVLGSVSYGIDITDQRAAETRYRSLFEHMVSGAAVWHPVDDGEDFVLRELNEQGERLSGVRRREVLGRRAREAFPGIEAFGLLAVLREVHRSGRPAAHPVRFYDDGRTKGWFENKVYRLPDGDVVAVYENVTARVEADELLRSSEERFRTFFEQTPICYQSLDADGRILDVNAAWLEALGYRREEVLGRWFGDLLAAGGAALFRERFALFKERGRAEGVEFDVLRKDGAVRTVSFNGRVEHDAEGRFRRTHCAFVDVTERKQAASAVVHSERLLSDTQRIAHIGSWEHLVASKEDSFSAEMARLFGLDPSSPAPDLATQLGFVHPEDRPRFAELRRRALAEGSDFEERFRVLRPDGRITWLSGTGHAERGGDGSVVRLFGTMQDVTSQVQDQEALRSSEGRYRMLAETLSDYAYSCLRPEEGPYRIDWVGGGFQKVAGRADAELLAQGCWLPWVHPDDQGRVEAQLHGLKPGSSAECEYRLVRPDGGERLVRDRMLCIAEPGEEVRLRLYGAVRDVTEARRLERELLGIQKVESLGVLAGGIAHDFNNMLTGILGNIALVKTELPKGELRAMLEEAESSARSAQSLTQQLLTFSKGGKPMRKPFALGAMLIEAANFAVRGSNCVASFELAPELWAVDGDQGQLRQVVHNLVLNATQATPQGGEVVVSAENAELGENSGLPLELGRYVRVKVRDAGTGISPEHLTSIFDPYFSTKAQGRGLGLSMVISVVRSHGGHVGVASQLGVGTEFTLHLPAAAGRLEEEGSVAELPRGYGRVLVMEDDVSVGRLAARMLSRLGYEPAVALHGEEALAALESGRATSRPFRAVLMDLVIPGKMGGKETIARLRASDRIIKVIVASGYSNDPILAEYTDYGFDAVLPKPFKIEALAATLQKLLGGA